MAIDCLELANRAEPTPVLDEQQPAKFMAHDDRLDGLLGVHFPCWRRYPLCPGDRVMRCFCEPTFVKRTERTGAGVQ